MGTVVGIVHPGQMGAALGAVLGTAGRHTVLCALDGRSPATVRRARGHGIEDAGTLVALAARCDVVLSVCPPSAAGEVADSIRGFEGLYVDANAVSPDTARSLWRPVDRFVDGAILGPPPGGPRPTRLYLSGTGAGSVAALFEDTIVEVRVLGEEPGLASALKMAYAGWAKGSLALLLACRALARAENVDEPLLREWSEACPNLEEQVVAAARTVSDKAWRFVGEMEEIAASMEAAGLPEGFHAGAAELFRMVSQLGLDDDPLERFLARVPRSESRQRG